MIEINLANHHFKWAYNLDVQHFVFYTKEEGKKNGLYSIYYGAEIQAQIEFEIERRIGTLL